MLKKRYELTTESFFQTCIQALKLCRLAIENFMPPNMVLLINSNDHMDQVGETLFKRLHDVNWEIRDSVLEVLNSIVTISKESKSLF